MPSNIAKPITIAVLSDIHFGQLSTISSRRTDIADILFLRAIHRINRYSKPDVVVILGDILDAGDAPDAGEKRKSLCDSLEKLDVPVIIIPGNHDGDVDAFYQDFTRPEPIIEIGGVRFMPFIDAEAPGYNATRAKRDIMRFKKARHDFDGPLVSLQHVCLHPPGQVDIPYNYTNAQKIITAMQEASVDLSISGHYHKGAKVVVTGTSTFVNVSGLCEHPFPFTLVRLDNNGVRCEVLSLAMPESLQLVDRHVHTQLAYCQENMTISKAVDLSQAFGLHGIGFAEHSGQLYFPQDQYWDGKGYRTGLAGALSQNNRMDDYMALKAIYGANRVRFGMEVDIDFRGNLLLRQGVREKIDYLIGSVHSTPSIKVPGVPLPRIESEFMDLMDKLLRHNVDAIAHPFRVFKRANLPKPENLYNPVADMLAKNNTAAEINFHINEPPLAFIQGCLQRGVKFSLGSDAHNLYEVGEFYPHLQLLRDAGFDGDFSDILLPSSVGGFD